MRPSRTVSPFGGRGRRRRRALRGRCASTGSPPPPPSAPSKRTFTACGEGAGHADPLNSETVDCPPGVSRRGASLGGKDLEKPVSARRSGSVARGLRPLRPKRTSFGPRREGRAGKQNDHRPEWKGGCVLVAGVRKRDPRNFLAIRIPRRSSLSSALHAQAGLRPVRGSVGSPGAVRRSRAIGASVRSSGWIPIALLWRRLAA